MYMKDGQVFMREAFINQAWLNSVVVTDKMQSENYVRVNRVLFWMQRLINLSSLTEQQQTVPVLQRAVLKYMTITG